MRLKRFSNNKKQISMDEGLSKFKETIKFFLWHKIPRDWEEHSRGMGLHFWLKAISEQFLVIIVKRRSRRTFTDRMKRHLVDCRLNWSVSFNFKLKKSLYTHETNLGQHTLLHLCIQNKNSFRPILFLVYLTIKINKKYNK